MGNKLIKKVFTGQSFHSSDEVYQFLAKEIDASLSQELVEKLHFRENLANIQIYRQTVLPHLESSALRQSQLFILRLPQPIEHWSETIKDIRLIVCLALKTNEDRAIKEQIKHFMVKLAADAYVEKLLTDSKSTIEKML